MLETLLATGLTLGLHIGTWHTDPGLNNTNPGIYAIAPSGLTGGIYRNSLSRPSVYAGYSFQSEDRTFALLVGGVTGYSRPLMPMVIPSARVGMGQGFYGRVSALSKPPGQNWGLAGVHFSVERDW
jgi:hypothetical protein